VYSLLKTDSDPCWPTVNDAISNRSVPAEIQTRHLPHTSDMLSFCVDIGQGYAQGAK